jgi:hypothetical protein
MLKYSPQVIGQGDVHRIANSMAIMMLRSEPRDTPIFDNAEDISIYLNSLPNGRTTLKVDVNNLKRGLANHRLRGSLTTMFPGRLEFEKSYAACDIITVGPFSFRASYKIKISAQCDSSDRMRSGNILNKQDDAREAVFEDLRSLADLRSRILQCTTSILRCYDNDVETTVSLRSPKVVDIAVFKKIRSPRDTPDDCSTSLSYFSLDSLTDDRKRGRLVTSGNSSENASIVSSDPHVPPSRGRPRKSEEEMKKEIINLRRRLKYYKELKNQKYIVEDEIHFYDENESKREIIGHALLKLIEDGDSYHQKINGENCVSITAGLLLQDLISNSGISVEKLPLAIGTVITLLFGKIDEVSYSKIVKGHNTYALASERTALLVVLEVRNRFTDRTVKNRVLNAQLILDASNKKGKGCVGKIVIIVCPDGVVRQLSLRLDTTVTKKAIGSSNTYY